MEEKVVGKEKKSNIILITILVILLLIAAFGFGYALCASNIFNIVVKENTSSEKSDDAKEKWEDVNENTALIEVAKKFAPKELCGGVDLDLEKRDRDVSELSKDDRVKMTISLGLCEKSEVELGAYFKDLSFLDVIKPSFDTCSNAVTGAPCHEGAKHDALIGVPMYINYVDGRFYCEKYTTGCAGPSYEGDYFKYLGAKKNDTTLKVEYLHYYQVPDYDEATDKFIYRIYKDKGDTDPLYTISGEVGEEVSFDKSKFDGYQYVFDITNSNMQLTKINYLSELK